MTERSVAVAEHVARALADPHAVSRWYAAAGPPVEVTEGALDPADLAHGATGSALLFAMLARHVSREWQRFAHEHLMFAVEHLLKRDDLCTIGLFSGAAGVLAVAKYASEGKHYRGLLDALIARIEAVTPVFARAGLELPLRFETMTGLAGVLASLDADDRAAPIVEASLCELVRAALETAGDAETVNFSVSHGLCGPLAALSLRGASRDAEDCARGIAALLIEARVERADGVLLPGVMKQGRSELVRQAWCYGTPGAAVALMFASRRFSLGHEDVAARALETVLRMDPAGWGSKDDALCHGIAGNALCFLAVGGFDERYRAFARELLSGVAERFDAGLPVGYVTVCPPYGSVHCGSFLTGAGGIAVALLADAFEDPTWMRTLALA